MAVVVVIVVGCTPDPVIDGDGPPGAAIVIDVLDGDTIVADIGGRATTVRLIGIDTPESTTGPRPPECFGDEATQFTRALLPLGTAVVITRDIEPRDAYDRLLGYVHRAADQLFVNRALAAHGYAVPLSIEPNTTYRAEFATDSRSARAISAGLWAECGSADEPLGG